MFDFTFTHGSLSLCLYCFLFFVILVSVNYTTCTNPHIFRGYPSYKRLLFLIGVAVFSVTCFINGDFYNYQELVHEYDFSIAASNHVEPVYGFIIRIINRNYLIFRIIVWGGGFIILTKAIKCLGLDDYKVIYYLMASFILTFSYARASLAFSIYFLGLSLVFSPINKTLIKRLLGLALIVSSYFFHHSMVIAIALTPIILLPFDRITIVLGALLIPVIFTLFSNVINSVINNGVFLDNEELADQIAFYAERTTNAINWKGKIYEWSNYASFFLPLAIITFNCYFRKKGVLPFYIEVFYKIAFSLTLVAIMFLFLDIEGKVFFYRILFMTFIPLSIVVYYSAANRLISRKMFIFLIYVGLGAQLYRFLYSMYLYI